MNQAGVMTVNWRKYKVLLIYGLFLSMTLWYFWSQSRYPALQDKSFMAARSPLSGIAFDILYQVLDDDGLWPRVVKNTVNWYYTNWKGMTFGLIFATLMASLLSHFTRFSFLGGGFRATGLGILFGAPLGVCANCSTPIGYGLRDRGVRAEASIAVVLSSPTLNIIVWTTMFQAFSSTIIAAKVVFSLALFGILPLLVRMTQKNGEACDISAPAGSAFAAPEDWLGAFTAAFLNIFKNFFRIFLGTVPLMVLAGLLGSMTLELIDFETVMGDFSYWKLMLISLLGSALPVPMMFDVVFAQMLLDKGAAVGLSVAMLLTLGPFSVYPFMMFWRQYSPRLALTVFLAISGLGALVGGVTHHAMALSSDELRSSDVIQLQEDLEMFRSQPDQYIHGLAESLCEKNQLQRRCFGAIKAFFGRTNTGVEKCDQYSGKRRKACLGRIKSAPLAECLNSDRVLQCFENLYGTEKERLLDLDLSIYRPSGELARKELAGLRTVKKALRSSVMVKCEGLETQGSRDLCFYVVGKRNIKLKMVRKAEEHCQSIKNSGLSEMCFLSLAVEVDDIPCLGTDGRKRTCEAARVAKEAYQNGNLSLCRQRASGFEADECAMFYQIRVAREKIRSLRFLSSIEDVEDSIVDLEDAEETIETASAPAIRQRTILDNAQLKIESFSHRARTESLGRFEKVVSDDLGLIRYAPRIFETNGYPRGFGMTSGDFNGDGWPDVVYGSYNDVYIFKNIGGRFARVAPGIRKTLKAEHGIDLSPVNVTLVDIDNDGWQDLYISNFDGKNFFLMNKRDEFATVVVRPIDADPKSVTITTAFADFDRNGLLDLFLGTGAYNGNKEKQWVNRFSANRLLMNRGESFQNTPFSDNAAQTLVSLSSDLDGDGYPDIVAGNDFSDPDQVWKNEGGERFSPVGKSSIPITAKSTMSWDIGDINNDGYMDLYAVGESRTESLAHADDYCQSLGELTFKECTALMARAAAFGRREAVNCRGVDDPKERLDCIAASILYLTKGDKRKEMCDLVPEREYLVRFLCSRADDGNPSNNEASAEDIPQRGMGNVLLMGEPGGRYAHKTSEYKVSDTGWGWAAKFADFDNDGWLDLYGVNGRPIMSPDITSNVYYRNIDGKNFENQTAQAGLEDFAHATSAIYLDFDLDGDVDILTNAVMAPFRFYINKVNDKKTVTFSFRDRIGNSSCVGCRLKIFYVDKSGRQRFQIREVKLSGGYASYDQHMVHFGLGDIEAVDSIEVTWSTGEKTTLQQSFPAGNHYMIERKTR